MILSHLLFQTPIPPSHILAIDYSSCFLFHSKYQPCCIFSHTFFLLFTMNELFLFLFSGEHSTQILLNPIPFCLLKNMAPVITSSALSCRTLTSSSPPPILCLFQSIILWVYIFGFHFLSSHSLKFTPISLSPQCSTGTALAKVP